MCLSSFLATIIINEKKYHIYVQMTWLFEIFLRDIISKILNFQYFFSRNGTIFFVKFIPSNLSESLWFYIISNNQQVPQ